MTCVSNSSPLGFGSDMFGQTRFADPGCSVPQWVPDGECRLRSLTSRPIRVAMASGKQAPLAPAILRNPPRQGPCGRSLDDEDTGLA